MSDPVPTYQNPDLPLAQRVNDLVSQLTLTEKIAQMLHPAKGIPRLNVPDYNWWNECLHGVARAGLATVFPQAIGLAATWNTDLHFQIAEAIADEARAKHHDFDRRGIHSIYGGLTFWTPNINIFRDPRWGRGQETYGEDPYLTSRLGVTFIKGLQGSDAHYLKLAATAKHYAVHSGPERDRHSFDAQVSLRDLWDTYLPAFEVCVKEGQVESVMGAYNRTNGEACCASPTLLQKILREEWGFQGHVTSDCWAICDIFRHHKLVDTVEQAAALAVKNGCDLNCGDAYSALHESVGLGLISEAEIDTALRRLFATRFKLGMFDPAERVPYSRIPYSVNHCPEHQALALRAAHEAMVLLKNENNVLPLSRNLKSIAVIGPNADSLPALLGNYNGTPAAPVTVVEGIRHKLGAETAVYSTPGCFIAQDIPPTRPIPSECLRPTVASTSQAGLTATYYGQADDASQPAFTRIDSTIDFVWQGKSPVSGEIGGQFAVRWEGYLAPVHSGRYKVGMRGLTDYLLEIDGQKIVARHAHENEPVIQSREMDLEGGRLYRLRIEYRSSGLDPYLQLFWSEPTRDYDAEALAAARQAEAIVVVLGLAPYIEGEEMPIQVPGFVGGDRSEITLPAPQEKLLRRLTKLGKPLALVLMNGSALGIRWAKQNVPAILEAWYPGEAGGTAVADVLFGDYNPAGRLPVTFYTSAKDLPPFEDYAMAGRTYRYFKGQPLFPFGFGLSYTTFEYSQLTIDPPTAAAQNPLNITVTATVRNTGQRAGDEVVQLYVADRQASVPVPICHLEGFKRIHLAAGEQATVAFTLTPQQLALVDEQGKRVLEPGDFDISVGGGQPSQAGTVTARLTIN